LETVRTVVENLIRLVKAEIDKGPGARRRVLTIWFFGIIALYCTPKTSRDRGRIR